jgi:hypothetical protein
MTPTAEKAIEAYGGRQLWSEATRLEAEFSASGLAFTLKRRPHFRRGPTLIAIELHKFRLKTSG